MGDDNLDIASLIASAVGVPPAPTDEQPEASSLSQTLARLAMTSNAFEVLGLTQEADTDAIRSAYMDLANHLHPDRYSDASEAIQEQATDAFDQVRAAWEDIDTPEKRTAHIDHVILGKPTEDEIAMTEVKALLDAEADFKKGLAAFNAGRISAAHKCFESAVANAPEELEFCAYKAYTTFTLNRKTALERAMGALSDLKDILDANQHQQRRLDGGWVLLGRAYRELGENEAAKRALVQALKYNPANPDAPRELRRLEGRSAGKKAKEGQKKPGFFGKLFGKK
jgi:tetratricopeptide (TPR) repeat protein